LPRCGVARVMVQWRYFDLLLLLLLSVGVGCDAGAAGVVADAVGISVGAGTLMGKGRVICCEEESSCDGGGGKRGVTRGAAQGGSGTRAERTLNGSSTVRHMNYSISNPNT
jgi:hypothetical protein